MNYVIFDREWNQCPDVKAYENPEIPFEILEIGAVKLNKNKEETDSFHELIRPSVYRRLHFRSREILHMTEKELHKAAPFREVIERFRVWCGEDAVFCIWGSLDFLELQRNMRYHGVENFFPFPLTYLDVHNLFSLLYEDGKSRRTLEHAVDFLHINKEKHPEFHSAFTDAYYTAEVLRHITDSDMTRYISIDYFRCPQKRKEEICLNFGSYSKFVSKEFATKTEAMNDRVVTCTKNYMCLAYCEEHGYLKGKIRMKKSENGPGYFCVKTIKVIDVDKAGDLLERKLAIQDKRRMKKNKEDSSS